MSFLSLLEIGLMSYVICNAYDVQYFINIIQLSLSLQELPFEGVWHSGRPNCLFCLKPKQQESSEKLTCVLKGYQKDRPQNITKIRVIQREQIPVSAYYGHILKTKLILFSDC